MKFSSILVCCCAILPILTLSELVGIEESTLAEIAEAENANREAMVERHEQIPVLQEPVAALEQVEEAMNMNAGNNKNKQHHRRTQFAKGGRPAGGIRQNGGDPRYNNGKGIGRWNNGRGKGFGFDDAIFGRRFNDDRWRRFDDDRWWQRDRDRFDDRIIDDPIIDDEFRDRDNRFNDDRFYNRNDRGRHGRPPFRGPGGNPVRNQRARAHYVNQQSINGLHLRNNRRPVIDDLFD